MHNLYRAEGLDGIELTHKIEVNFEVTNVLLEKSRIWDGGFVICGAIGSGDMFALRDPHGIRPAF